MMMVTFINQVTMVYTLQVIYEYMPLYIMWNLAVYLPLMIGDLVPESDKEWECFLLLLEILQICVSSVFQLI